MTSEPLVLARHPPHDKCVDRAEVVAKLRGVEAAIIAHPTREDWANLFGDVFQLKVTALMHAPPSYAESYSLGGLLTHRWEEVNKALAGMVDRQSRPESKAEKVEGPFWVIPRAICIFAIYNLGLLRMQLQQTLRKPTS